MNAPVKPNDETPKGATTEASARTDELRKYVIARPGGYDKLVLKTGPALEPRAGEVVISVRAVGVNYADSMVRMGLYQSAKEFVGWPVTPGFEVAGVVRALGAGVTDLAVGDRVLAVTLFGGYASEIAVARAYVFRTPARLSDLEAAGFPAVYMTAYYALFELAHPRRGAKVLIHSAAGGVGGCLVQLAKVAGCEVTAVVGSAHKIETARAQGADHVIDKSHEDLWRVAERIAPDGFDVVCDANGVSTLKDSYRHLRKAGKLVVYGFHSMLKKGGSGRPNWLKLGIDYVRTPRFNPLELTNESKSILAFNLSYLFDRQDILQEAMTALVGWLEAGAISAPPCKSYPFERAAEAQRDIESGQTVGKLVLAL
jgi:NADPH:quinone reductase-like Zn-dependent oxidoreductase